MAVSGEFRASAAVSPRFAPAGAPGILGAALAGAAFAFLRTLPPDRQLAVPDAGVAVGAATGALLGLVVPLLLTRVWHDTSAGEIALRLRPVGLAALTVLAAWPLRLIVFHDPAPILLVGGVGIGSLASAWRLRALGAPRCPALVAGAVVAVVVALLAVIWPQAQGDEPHYLTVAHSLVYDGDLDVADDYADRVFSAYHSDALSPHYRPGLQPDRRYSMHGAGYPLFLAPAYALGSGVSPAGPLLAARLTQAMVFGLFAVILLRLAALLLGTEVPVAAALVALLSAPLLFAPLHLFPETPAMTAAAAGFLLLLEKRGPRNALAAGACLAVLPWLGVKYIPLALVTAMAGVCLGGITRRRVLAVAAPMGLALALHGAFTWTLYGSVSPSAVYLGADPDFGRQPGYGGDWAAYVADWPVAVRTAVGYFLDQKEGLLAVGPHYLLAVPGLVVLWRRRRMLVVWLGLIVVALLGPYALSQQLGGHSPPARPLMAVSWALWLPLAAGLLAPMRGAGNVLRGALLGLSAALTAFLAWDPSLLPHDYGVGASWTLRALSPLGVELWRWFPSWVNVGGVPWGVNLLWLALVAGLGGVLVRALRTAPPACGRPPRSGWAAATVVLAGAGVAALLVSTAPLSDRHTGREIAPGLQAWVVSSRPEGAWAEPGGLWIRAGRRRPVVYTTGDPVAQVEGSTRALVDTDAEHVWGAARWSGQLRANVAVPVGLVPGVGWPWRGGRAYRGWSRAASGAPPATFDGGADWRPLGALLQIEELRFDAR